MKNNNKQSILLLLFLFVINLTVIDSLEQLPQLVAQSYILYDYTTGRVLCEKNADMVIAPASMAKPL